MRKLNCWEFQNCGRETGGLMVETFGECPVATAMNYDGTNGGIAGGRACWMVQSNGEGLARIKICAGSPCHICKFYRRVMHEEETSAKHQLTTTVA